MTAEQSFLEAARVCQSIWSAQQEAPFPDSGAWASYARPWQPVHGQRCLRRGGRVRALEAVADAMFKCVPYSANFSSSSVLCPELPERINRLLTPEQRKVLAAIYAATVEQ